MQAIILAGGFGTRLKSLVQDVPKPMAPVAGRPFLAWLLEYMESQGVHEVVLGVHHQYEIIQSYFGAQFGRIRIHYSVEGRPLGTGGAIRQAMELLKPKKPFFALNGDSVVEVDYQKMMAYHMASGRTATIATRRVPDCSRYSQLTIDCECIAHYELLGDATPGEISTGFYVLSPDVFDGAYLPGEADALFGGFTESSFSFERDFLSVHAPALRPAAYGEVEYFIDIGIPEDYIRAQKEIPAKFSPLPLAGEGGFSWAC